MSASLNWMPWKAAIGLPNCWRSCGVVGGVVGRALGEADGLRRDAEARAVEGRHRDLEAPFSSPIRFSAGNADVVEDRLAGGRSADPHLLLELADGEPGPVGLDDERRDPARVALLGVGDREADVEVGDPEVGDPVLGPVDHPLVAVADGLGPHPARVRARVGLGERERRRPLARGALGQEALLLLVGAEQVERQRAELLDHQDQGARGAGLRNLLDRDVEHQRAGAGAAVLLANGSPIRSWEANSSRMSRGYSAFSSISWRARRDLLDDHLADRLAEVLELLRDRHRRAGLRRCCSQAAE